MMKTSPKQNAFLHLAHVLLIIVCFIAADAQAAGRCNGTRISDCLADEEEMLMESESSRRILQARKPPQKHIDITKTRTQYCKRDKYGSCFPGANKNVNSRPCNYRNYCHRGKP